MWLDPVSGHRGGANRIAFWADSEEEVNRLGKIVMEAGARVVEGPEYCHDYTPGYYAVFFEDSRREQVGDLLPDGAGEVRSGLGVVAGGICSRIFAN